MTAWSYACAPSLGAQADAFRLRPIDWEDRQAIRQWRNEQIEVLRQERPLSEEDQDRYFGSVVRAQLDEEQPAQVLVAFLEQDRLIGYGGIVHINWGDRRGEVSFLTETSRAKLGVAEDWQRFLDLLIPCARDQLGLHKLTTESYAFRTDVMSALESRGFQREGVLSEHHWWNDRWHDSVLHGRLLNAS